MRALKLSILYDVIRWEEKALHQAALKRGMEIRMIDVKDMEMDSEVVGEDKYGDIILQRTVSYYRSLHSTAYLEFLGKKVVNSLKTSIITGNKFFTTLVLKKHGIPTPRTIVTVTERAALKAFDKLGGKAVLKPVIGSWGRLVALLENKIAAKAVIESRELMYPVYQIYYMQEFINRPPRDIRTFVIGDQVVAAIYRYQPEDDWRTNTSRGGRAVKCEITTELEEISLKAAKAVGGGVLGIDIMESENGYLVHEINNTTEFRNTVPVTGIDIPALIIEYLLSISKK